MRKSLLVGLLMVFIAVGAMANVYTDRAVTAMEYVTNPVNGMYHQTEGLVWINTDPTNAAAPAVDNQSPAYLGAYFWTTAGLLAGMNATDVNVPYAHNAIERVFINNFDFGEDITFAGGIEPWYSESTTIGGWTVDSLLMADAQIPWRFDPTMSFAASASDVYLERVLWATYFLTLCDNIEYSQYIARVLRGIRNNPTYYNSTNGAIKYNGVDNTYLTALWGLVLESYMRSFESYPVLRPGYIPIEPPPTDYDWSEESEGAWLFVMTMLDYYFGSQLPSWWSSYWCPESDRSPMDPARGLERWEYLPVMMFAAAHGEIDTANGLWDNHMDDVGVNTWRNDVRDYFRQGAIWNGSRGYYAPLHRRPAIYVFYELGQMEMYRATLDTQYINRILNVEDNRFNSTYWTGDFWDQSPSRHGTPMWNGLHAWVLAHLPNIEIVGIESNLPSEGPLPYDYSANTGQDHVVTVWVANNGLVPIDSLLMTVNEDYAGGSRTGAVYCPLINPGEVVGVTYDIGGPGLPGDHNIYATFMDEPWVAGYTVVDSDLVIDVQTPVAIDMIATIGDPVTAPNSPLVSRLSEFNIEVQIQNNGGSTIRELELDLSQSSPYGLAFTFTTGTHFDGVVDIPGGTTGSIYFPVVAPADVGAALGDDILVEVDLVDAIDENTRLSVPPGDIVITDDEEYFDIQHRAWLTPTGFGTTTGWVNATDIEPVTVWFSNSAGDVGEADSLDVYSHTLELISSVVTGIGGTDAPSLIDASVAAGAAGSATFDLFNDGASENAIVDVHYVGYYHDGNNGNEAFSPHSPMDVTYVGSLGIDVLYPDAQPLAPAAGTFWPPDDWVRVEAWDNLSGVGRVEIFVMDFVGVQYWDFTTGTWGATPDTVALSYYAAYDEWRVQLVNHPAGNCVMFVLCWDNAGNQMPPEYVPLGDIYYGHIVEIGADLWRGGPLAPVDPLADYEYECDWNWVYECSVLVFNPNGFTLNNVELDLFSTSPYTGIVDLTGATSIGAYASIWYRFEVTEPGYTFKDSLYAHISDGTDAVGNPIGEQVTDNDFRVWVEMPVDFEIVDVWIEPESIEVWIGDPTDTEEDTALVSHYQTFAYYATFRNNGEDVIDSVEVAPFQSHGFNSIITPTGPFTYYNKGQGWTETLFFGVIADTLDPGINPEQFDQFMMLIWDDIGFTAHNHPPGYTTGLSTITDDRAPIGIQEPSLLDEFLIYTDGDSNFVWLNMTNTVAVELGLWNQWATAAGTPKTDRAAADRINDPAYDCMLTFMDPTYTWNVTEVIDRENPIYVTSTLVEPGDSTYIGWEITWDGTPPPYEGALRIFSDIEYGDQNWQSQFDSRYSPANRWFSTDYLGIDVSRPTCEIIAPYDGGMYPDYPETIRVLADDAVSGLVEDSVKVQFENPLGEIWNGTDWFSGDWWFTAHYDIALGPDTFWYGIPTPDLEGCYTYRAYSWDVAGNQSLIDEVDFIWDATAPNSHINYPYNGYYSYTANNPWDQVIEVWALDDTTNAPYECVSHVRSVYVAIRDTLQDKWWNGSGWITAGTAYWLPCTPTSDPEIWEYLGYTDSASVILEFYCYARDSAGNLFAPDDTLQYVRVDEIKPNSVLTDQTFAELPALVTCNLTDWNTLMDGKIWGYAADSITRVDSVKYSIWESLSDMHWNGSVFVSSPDDIWLEPDEYNKGGGWFSSTTHPNPGIAVDFDDTLWWRNDWTPPDYGYYRIRSMCWDDMWHEEPGFDSQNEKWVIYDNCPPVIHPRFPEAGGIYYIGDWHDSLVVFAYDSCGYLLDEVDSVKLWITDAAGNYWGLHPFFLMWGWWPMPLSVYATPIAGETGLWQYRYPGLITAAGSYTMFVRAYDQAGNIGLNAWGWTITVTGAYLTIENVEPDPFFVDEHWHCRVVAWHHPGVVDTNFAAELVFGNTMPDPLDFEILTPGPYYTYRGTLDVECVGYEPILGLEVFVDAPTTTLPRASTEPIDIIATPDDDIAGYVMDNPCDQGNWLWIVHNRTPQDPDYCGSEPIDTSSIKIVDYYYFRDMDLSPDPADTDWQPVTIVEDDSDCDSIRIRFGNFNTFVQYDYSMFVEFVVQGLGIPLFTDRLYLGDGVPVDNCAPLTITDLTIDIVGGDIYLEWPEIASGIDTCTGDTVPEIDPATNIVYDIYRFTDPYGTIGTPLVTGWTVPNYTDVTGAGDITTQYYYVVKGRDYNNNETPDESNRVGEVDYEVADGWNAVAYPLPVTGLDQPDDYATRLGVPFVHMYSYVNPPGGWNGLMVGGIPFWNITPGLEDMTAYVTGIGTGIYTWTGDLPTDSTAIYYTLANTGGNGWNGIMLPLHHGHITTAEELYYELDGLGFEPITVARRVPGGGWQSIVVIGGTVYFDFDIYPGQAYMVWVEAGGNWPAYARIRYGKTNPAQVEPKVQDVIRMPLSTAIPVITEDNAEIDEVVATATSGESTIDCYCDKGVVKVEFSEFDDIKAGAQVVVEVSADNGTYVGNTTITVPEGPVEIAAPLTLTKARPELPKEFALHNNIPNPFNPATTIKFDLPEDAVCDLAVFNINGRKVRTLVSEDLKAGYHKVVWNGADDSGRILPGGIYFYRLRAGDFSAQRRMMFVK
ncbi:hypothetical protein DRQ36_01110 [bacterium]|nr:MAG: hypothetical protein DRQ36_01110 [bacterium]